MRSTATTLWACLLAGAFVSHALAVCFPDDVEDADGNTYVPVTSKAQLWRYQVGTENTGFVNVGDSAMCFYTSSDRFVSSHRSDPVVHDRTWCRPWERFTIEFVGNQLSTIKTWFQFYLSCRDDGVLAAAEDVGENEKFSVYINEDEEIMAFYVPSKGTWVSAVEGGSMRCDIEDLKDVNGLYGWKGGHKEAWAPVDWWQYIETYDNPGPDAETHSFVYENGYSFSYNPSATLNVPEDTVEAGPELPTFFQAGIVTRTDTDWTSVNAQSWKKPTVDAKGEAEVDPSTSVDIFHALGAYGVFVIHSDHTDYVSKPIPTAKQ